MPNDGFPTGDIFKALLFVIRSIPQNVKYRWTSQSIAAAVVAIMNGGNAMSIVPLEHTINNFFFSLK
jgi:hypothetical protein